MNMIEAKEAYTSVLYEDVLFPVQSLVIIFCDNVFAIFKCYDLAAFVFSYFDPSVAMIKFVCSVRYNSNDSTP